MQATQSFLTSEARHLFCALDWRYRKCNLCPLAKKRNKVVHFRGTIPCDILFIGEAPGLSEDYKGFPFVGEAGTMLEELIDAVLDESTYFTFAMTNIVSCIPLSPEKEIRQPTPSEGKACNDRLREFVGIANPKTIIALGAVAKKHIAKTAFKAKPKIEYLVHPSYLERLSGTKQNIEIKKFRSSLTRIVNDLSLVRQ